MTKGGCSMCMTRPTTLPQATGPYPTHVGPTPTAREPPLAICIGIEGDRVLVPIPSLVHVGAYSKLMPPHRGPSGLVEAPPLGS